MYKQALISGTLLGALAVILGAFGAHKLKETFSAGQLMVFETGIKYHFYHCFALLVAGIMFSSFPFNNIKIATVFFILGIAFFSGSLYLFPFIESRGGGIPTIARLITPLGGLFFIIGWIELFLAVIKKN